MEYAISILEKEYQKHGYWYEYSKERNRDGLALLNKNCMESIEKALKILRSEVNQC